MLLSDALISQFRRVRELYQELITECAQRVTDPLFPPDKLDPRISILAGEVLIKLQTILDHTAYDVFEAKIRPNYPSKKDQRVYFPIVQDKNNFEGRLKAYQLDELKILSPSTYDILLDAQPFTRTDNYWLGQLQELANFAKHREIIRAERSVIRAVSWLELNGQPPQRTSKVNFRNHSYEITMPGRVFYADDDPQRPIGQQSTEYVVTFDFSILKNALLFLDSAIEKTEQLVSRVLNSC